MGALTSGLHVGVTSQCREREFRISAKSEKSSGGRREWRRNSLAGSVTVEKSAVSRGTAGRWDRRDWAALRRAKKPKFQPVELL